MTSSNFDPKTVLLINPNLMRPPVTPVALDYICSALSRHSFRVDILDLSFAASWQHELDDYLQNRQPLLIGLSVRNTDDCYYLSHDFIIPRIKEIVDHIRQRTDRPMILGGVGFSVMPQGILEFLNVDLGIWGDGEWSLSDFVLRLSKNEDPHRTPGLIYRKDGRLKRNPAQFRDLHDLPLPKRDAVDNARYFREGGMVGIETKRGCNQRCIYCADPVAKGKSIRSRPPKIVVDEIEQLLGNGVDYLHVCDSEFNLPYGHAVEVCKEIVGRGLGERVKWYAYLSPVPFTMELASLMKKAGCQGIDFGVDHGDDRMLENLGRKFKAEELRRTAAICHECNITFMYDLLLGGPEEDKRSLRRAIDLMKEINPTRVGISAGIRIYPGTRLAELLKDEEGHRPDLNIRGVMTPDFLAPVFYVSQEIGDDLHGVISGLIGSDERFYFGGKEEDPANYNYNENSILMEAIKKGYRGAFWDILRKQAEGLPPDLRSIEV
jgi:radical SAM superfamily enzyme YgiQ (UPF0313 family)